MDEKAAETALVLTQADFQVALRGAVSLWASAMTSDSERRADLLRDKQRIVLSFFRHTGKLPSEVEPADVQGWLRDLEGKGISAGTCYQHACLLSSFYSWAMKDPEVGRHVRRNPARLARPKAPKPYQTESVKALSDEEVGVLVAAVRRRALSGDVVGKRDYALLLLYLAMGLRRNEAIGEGVRAQLSSRVAWHYLLPELSVAEVKAIVGRALGADASDEVVTRILNLTGGVYRHVDMLLPRVLDLMERHYEKLESKEASMNDLIDLAASRLMLG